MILRLLMLALSLSFSAAVLAHKASDSFLYWNVDAPEAGGRLDIALMDLARIMPLDTDGDGLVTWGELDSRTAALQATLARAITLTRGAGECPLSWSTAGLTHHSDGAYLALRFMPDCPASATGETALRYGLFFDRDPLHRALVMIREAGENRLAVLGPDSRVLNLDAAPTAWQTATSFIWAGMVHLWIGYDHMLFLLALVLPAAVRRERGHWVVEDRIGVAIKDVAMIVTAFTLAHSLTLVIATLGLVRLPIAWVETLIALSIVAAAVNIVWPFLGRRRYLMGFGFGLIHGFGFASVLSEFMANTPSRAIALASFNIGVELAQLVVVVVVVPLIFLVRRQWLYQRLILPAGVAAITAVALLWVWQRAPIGLA